MATFLASATDLEQLAVADEASLTNASTSNKCRMVSSATDVVSSVT